MLSKTLTGCTGAFLTYSYAEPQFRPEYQYPKWLTTFGLPFPNFKNKNSGEIPRLSVDQGLPTSPISDTTDLFICHFTENILRGQCNLENFQIFFARVTCKFKLYMKELYNALPQSTQSAYTCFFPLKYPMKLDMLSFGGIATLKCIVPHIMLHLLSAHPCICTVLR